ncbi:hypothetical protein J3F83DRAFT_721893 [Trichoderma novae-zelandiae]
MLGARPWSQDVSHHNVTGRDEDVAEKGQSQARSKVVMSGPSCVREQLHVSMPEIPEEDIHKQPRATPCNTLSESTTALHHKFRIVDAIGSTMGRLHFRTCKCFSTEYAASCPGTEEGSQPKHLQTAGTHR